jgi:lipid A 3-O-deacylase
MSGICFSNEKKYNFFFHLFKALVILSLFWVAPSVLYAQVPCASRDFRTFSLYIENDVFAGDDDQYTNGLKLTWSRYGLSELPEDAWAHRWLYPVVKRLGFSSPDSEKALTFSIGQNMYTPRDIEETQLIRDDRPYAGVTYIEIGFHRKLDNHMHTLGLCAGIVGPHSYAEQLQTYGHALLSSDDTNGWDHQLEDEPVMCVIYDYKQKIFASNINAGIGGDAIFNTGGGIGNVRTFYNIGMMMRYGWNVPNDCGNFPIQPATCFNAELKQSTCDEKRNRFGVHLFLSGGGQAVLHDIFLDGNTFRDSHSVDKKPFVGVFMGGIGLVTGRVKSNPV